MFLIPRHRNRTGNLLISVRRSIPLSYQDSDDREKATTFTGSRLPYQQYVCDMYEPVHIIAFSLPSESQQLNGYIHVEHLTAQMVGSSIPACEAGDKSLSSKQFKIQKVIIHYSHYIAISLHFHILYIQKKMSNKPFIVRLCALHYIQSVYNTHSTYI